jgi:putative transposase
MNGRIYNLNHCTYYTHYHIVWTTRYRGKVIDSKWLQDEFKRIFKSISRWKKFEIKGMYVGEDHIHLYIMIPPKYSVAYAVNVLKGKSSSWIKKKTKKIAKGSFWNRGYFVSTIGISDKAIKRYIANQDRPKIEDIQLKLEKQA